MIFMMDFLIDACLIFAVWQIFIIVKNIREDLLHDISCKVLIETSITDRLASRAFNLANSATLGVVALQKALAIPRPLTTEQGALNTVAKEEVDELFKVGGTMEWMKPLMTEDELEAYEKALDLAEAKKAEGMNKTN